MKNIAESAGTDTEASGTVEDAAPRSSRLRVVIAGGGTGGHVYPALALADALLDRGVSVDRIHLIGARRGIEARLFPRTAFTFTLLSLRGLDRSRNLTAARRNIVALASLVLGVFRVVWMLLLNRPHCVVGVGGYASAPCVISARILGIPVVVHEQNALPGLVNRFAVRLGARAAVSLPGTPLKGAVLTGNPVRSAISEIMRTPDPVTPLLGIVGGSLGAGRLNEAALGLASRWGMRADAELSPASVSQLLSGRRDLRLHVTYFYLDEHHDLEMQLAATSFGIDSASTWSGSRSAIVDQVQRVMERLDF